MDTLGGRWGQETVVVFAHDFETPSFFTPLTTSSPPLLTTSNGSSHEMTSVRWTRLQEGPWGIFSHPTGVHFRHIHGAITECSPYWPGVEWPTSIPPNTRTHIHQFPPRGRSPTSKSQKFHTAAKDWKLAADLKEPLHLLHYIVHTQERPDIVIWSGSASVSSLLNWLYIERRTLNKGLRGRNSVAIMECELVKWCQSRLAVAASSVPHFPISGPRFLECIQSTQQPSLPTMTPPNGWSCWQCQSVGYYW